MRFDSRWLPAAACVCLLLPGCGWLEQRRYDFAEIVDLQGGTGAGAELDLSVASFLGFGLGYGEVEWTGWGNTIQPGLRRGYASGRQRISANGVTGKTVNEKNGRGDLLLPGWREFLILREFTYHRFLTEDVWLDEEGLWPAGEGEIPRHGAWRYLDLGLSLHCRYGFRFVLSPGKLLDALAGLCFLDPEGDDLAPEPVDDAVPSIVPPGEDRRAPPPDQTKPNDS